MNKKTSIYLSIYFLVLSVQVDARTYSYREGDSLIGALGSHYVEESESLPEIGRKFDLGYNEITDANRGIEPYDPSVGVKVTLPNLWVLPAVPPSFEGIVVNLAEMRLYYIFKVKGRNLVATFPVGIGTDETPTPNGAMKIVEKMLNPVWHVPESIRRENPFISYTVSPGPDNPLGTHALRLSKPDYLIHGTNKPWGIGKKSSHGCLRLFPEDIPTLYNIVNYGTRVIITSQPVKIGRKGNKVYAEIHRADDPVYDYSSSAERSLAEMGLLEKIDRKKLKIVIKEKSGIPLDITKK